MLLSNIVLLMSYRYGNHGNYTNNHRYGNHGNYTNNHSYGNHSNYAKILKSSLLNIQKKNVLYGFDFLLIPHLWRLTMRLHKLLLFSSDGIARILTAAKQRTF